jgi:hypothetical protein
MNGGRWLRHERLIARALGARRLPGAGYGRPDYRPPGWAVSVLTRATAPGWLWDALDRAGRQRTGDERAAVVLTAVSQGVRARRLVLLDFEEFARLVSEAQKRDEAATEDETGAV